MDKIYAWTETDPDDGEGVIMAVHPNLGMITLHTRKLRVAQMLRPLAQEHAHRSGHKVQLVRFDRVATLETL